MKLIHFDSETASGSRMASTEPSIRFHQSGIITISAAAAEKIKLKEGDKVSIAQDEDSPDDWYLITKDKKGFATRIYKGSNGLAFNNAYIAKSLINFLELKTKSVSFKLATEPAADNGGGKLYAILLATAKYSELKEDEENN
jgi:hypothetical protein